MAFDQNKRTENENKKFVDDGSGNPAIRVKVEHFTLSEDSTLKWYDHRGFLIMELDEATGDLRIKGAFVKL